VKITPVKTRIFKKGENLAAFILEHIPRVKEGSILAVTSKVVALSENRTARAEGVRAKEALIRSESAWVVPTKHVFVALKDGMLTANAGIDASNAKDGFVLLPKDSFRSAARLLKSLKRSYRVKRFGIILTDSRTMPLRAGVTAVALGYAGIKGLRDYRNKKDLFGRPFKFTRVNVPDSLATAAAFTMGEGDERQPLAVIEGAPVVFGTSPKTELRIAAQDDMYGPLLAGMFTKKPRNR
jgi:coenzyme F420-0:L-glutamate ligase